MTYRFAIMNIGTEICSKSFGVDAVDMEEDGILLLLNLLPELQLMPESIRTIMQDVQAACQEYIKVSLTIAVTPSSHDPHELRPLFIRARDASLHRFFQGRGSIISVADLKLQDSKSYTFPIEKEKRIVDALMTGKPDQAKELYHEVMAETSRYPIEIVRSASTHLTVTFGNVLSAIERNGSLELGLGTGLIIPHIDHYETCDELTSAYFAFFDMIKSTLDDKRSQRHEDLIARINAIIEDRYHDPNLSLNYIADELKLSTYHISRVYRQQTLTNIVDKINECRVDKAKEQLVRTNLPVAEIAENTGFTSSSYFHRIFKKLHGVTPAEYRKSN